ncbi:uncharacterized protein LOC144306121 isoform X2 [Canis aureus]
MCELRWTMNARSTQSWWFAEGSRCLYWFNTEVLTSSHQNKKNKSDNLNKSPTELFQMFQTAHNRRSVKEMLDHFTIYICGMETFVMQGHRGNQAPNQRTLKIMLQLTFVSSTLHWIIIHPRDK